MQSHVNDDRKGGQLAALPFSEINCVDTEFRSVEGNPPHVVCLVVTELRTGSTRRYFRDELLAMRSPPFSVGADALFVAFFATAEFGCFKALGWQLPENVVDLHAEHRVETNGIDLGKFGNSLIDAQAMRGLTPIEFDRKETMRQLILGSTYYSDDEREGILQYCESDVSATAALLQVMLPAIDLPRALLRGRYIHAVAEMEHQGIPIDVKIYARLAEEWRLICQRLVNATAVDYGFYDTFHRKDGPSFKFNNNRFLRWCADRGIDWPRLASGRPDKKDDTFKLMSTLHPEVAPVRELRRTVHRRCLADIPVGADGYARTSLSPFGSVTGRNQPSSTRFLFNCAKWLRGLARPHAGQACAYIDWSSQEHGLAAAFSGDERMIEAYRAGDPYIAFAIQAGLAPSGATKASHGRIRERCKPVVLGVNYGMGVNAMALAAGITAAEASELLTLHRRTYPTFWRWSQDSVDAAKLSGEMMTMFGWRRKLKPTDRPTSLMNFPMQAHGAEMMRIAAIAATEAGIQVCAPVHDAFFIVAPEDEIDEQTTLMRSLMEEAGAQVTGGLPIRTEAKVIRHPHRYMDPQGIPMWNKVVGLAGFASERIQTIA